MKKFADSGNLFFFLFFLPILLSLSAYRKEDTDIFTSMIRMNVFGNRQPRLELMLEAKKSDHARDHDDNYGDDIIFALRRIAERD